jgi:hypothetical protein
MDHIAIRGGKIRSVANGIAPGDSALSVLEDRPANARGSDARRGVT